MKYYWVVLWTLWAGRLVRQPTIPVRVDSGLLRGSIAADGSHISYLGVPYASYEERFQVRLDHITIKRTWLFFDYFFFYYLIFFY